MICFHGDKKSRLKCVPVDVLEIVRLSRLSIHSGLIYLIADTIHANLLLSLSTCVLHTFIEYCILANDVREVYQYLRRNSANDKLLPPPTGIR